MNLKKTFRKVPRNKWTMTLKTIGMIEIMKELYIENISLVKQTMDDEMTSICLHFYSIINIGGWIEEMMKACQWTSIPINGTHLYTLNFADNPNIFWLEMI